MADKSLKLNSLSRYTKQSPRLVLEEYSHCEVPAGCGGVVLRWRKPDEPIPMIIRDFSGNGHCTVQTLDGNNRFARLSKTLVNYGQHVLSMTFEHSDPRFAVIMFVGQLDPDYVRILHPEGDTTIVSLPDGTWKYSLEQPDGDAWRYPDFNDELWQPMVKKRLNPHPQGYSSSINSWTRALTEHGAVGLGINLKAAELRKLFPSFKHGSTIPAIYIRETFSILPVGEQK